MSDKKEINRIVKLLERKCELCIGLKECLLSFRESVQNGKTPEKRIAVVKRVKYIQEIDRLDKQILKNKELLSALLRGNNKESYPVKTIMDKLRKILEEISGIHNECLSYGQSVMSELKKNISSIRRQAQAFRSYIPYSNSPPRFVDTVR